MDLGKTGRTLVVIALTLASLPLLVPQAPAAFADLTPRGCIDDNDTGADDCVLTADGLDDPRAVAVSPDGKSVYVASTTDDALVLLNRDTQTGALTPAGCIDDNDSGTDACAQNTDGLNGAQTVAVSPDGMSVYATGLDDDAVVLFTRDIQTGALTPAGCIKDNDTGTDACAQSADGLDNSFGVAVSPDGASVYVAGLNDGALSLFDRSLQTGALTPIGCIDDNDTGADDCGQSSDGLAGAHTVAVSADGKSVYVSGVIDDALVSFNRDPQTRALTPAGCVDDNDTGADACAQSTNGLNSATGIGLSPDGKSVYVASIDDDALALFDRSTQTGALSPAGCIDDNDSGPEPCAQNTNGLDGALGVGVSPDGSSAYVAAELDNALVRFDRDPQTGTLAPASCVDDNDFSPDNCAQSTDGLTGARSVVLAADSRSVYVVGENDDALVRFDRQTDVTPPDTTITVGPEGPTSNPTPTFVFASSETGSTFECRIDLQPFVACSGPDNTHTTAVLADGLHTFEVQATDEAGNTDATPAGRSFTVDTDPPETTLRGPQTTTNRRPTFRLRSDETGSTFSCKLDARPYGSCTSPYRTPRLSFGQHVLKVKATDPVGNIDTTPAKKTFRVKEET